MPGTSVGRLRTAALTARGGLGTAVGCMFVAPNGDREGGSVYARLHVAANPENVASGGPRKEEGMVAGASDGIDWAGLATLDQAGQTAGVTDAYGVIADQDEAARHESLVQAISVVYAMPDPQLRSMTEARLRAWIALPPEKAALVGNSFESVMDEMPANLAMRRVTIVQSVAFRLTPEEIAHLQKIVPRVLGDAPPPTPSMVMGDGSKRPWWKFWAKA